MLTTSNPRVIRLSKVTSSIRITLPSREAKGISPLLVCKSKGNRLPFIGNPSCIYYTPTAGICQTDVPYRKFR